MAQLVIPISKVDDVDLGQDAAVTAVEDTVALAGGLYKIAAVGTPLKWRIGDTALPATEGSYLAAGDQELVRVPAPVDPATTRDLRFIRAPDALADGIINIVPVELYKVPGVDAREYEEPTNP
jgi:hypothetical protein